MKVFSVLLLFLGSACADSFKWSGIYPGKLSFKAFVVVFVLISRNAVDMLDYIDDN